MHSFVSLGAALRGPFRIPLLNVGLGGAPDALSSGRAIVSGAAEETGESSYMKQTIRLRQPGYHQRFRKRMSWRLTMAAGALWRAPGGRGEAILVDFHHVDPCNN